MSKENLLWRDSKGQLYYFDYPINERKTGKDIQRKEDKKERPRQEESPTLGDKKAPKKSKE